MRQSHLYSSVKESVAEYGYPAEACCNILSISRAAYYKWLSGESSPRAKENIRIAEIIEGIHAENPDKGHRVFGTIWIASTKPM